MKQLLLFLSPLLLLAACTSKPAEQKTQKERPLKSSFYKKYSGTIGQIPIVMDLSSEDSALSGSYYYTLIGVPLTLLGYTTPDGTLHLTEMDNKYEETGEFELTAHADGSLDGSWRNAKSGKTLSVFLHTDKDNPVNLSFKNKYRENCSWSEKIKKEAKPPRSMWDTMCTAVDLNLVTVSVPSQEASKAINNRITEAYCHIYGEDDKHSSIEELLNTVNEVEEDGFILTVGSRIITNDKGILCICIMDSHYDFGAAHPNSVSEFYNFEITTGKEITLEELLLPGYEARLNRIAEKIFIETNGEENWEFEKGKFELNKNFAITPGGLLFHYGQYEIGSYAMGMPEVFIPYKDMEDLINPNGLLKVWKKK